MREKSVTIFGAPKVGKSTVSSQFPNAIILATEVGYRALGGVYATDIKKWKDFTDVLKELEKPEVKARFETVVIDVVDILWSQAEKHVCRGAGVDKLSDVPFGALYKILADTFSEAIRSIPQMGYGVVFLTHAVTKSFTDENGVEFSKTVTTLNEKASGIILGASDVIGYAKSVQNPDSGETKTALFLRETPRFIAGSRFKYTPDVIEFNYKALVNAIADAIEKEASENASNVVDKKEDVVVVTERTFEDIKLEVDKTIANLMQNKDAEEQTKIAANIKKVIESQLGKKLMLKDTTYEQKDHVEIILDGLKELLN
jgi:hypothetical protein